jgi:mannitol-1-/sugar-/sorbitol-6-phosphatase
VIGVIDCGAILFDLDGTLVDSAEAVTRTWEAWALMHKVSAAEVVTAAQGRRAIDTIRAFAPSSNLMSEVARVEAIELSELMSVRPLPGSYELLSMLATDKWAVVTSGSRKLATARINACAFPFPPVLVTADDVGRGKPDPEGYMSAALRLQVDPDDCVVFEDAPAGVKAGQAAGCTVVALSTTHRPSDLRGADGIIPNLAALRLQRKDGRLVFTLRDS